MSNEPMAGGSLDPELLAAYIDKRLTPEQRAAVEAQLAADPDNYAVLVETMKALDAVKVPEPRAWRWVIAGGVLAAAAAIVLVVWTQPDLLRRLRGETVDPRLERLIAAVGEERYIDARLAGGFKYGPVRDATRGSGDTVKDNLELLAAAGELRRAAEADQSSDAQHAWAVARIVLGDLDGAISTLEASSRRPDVSSAVLSDLGAAYVARANKNGTTEDLPRALAAFDRALQLDSRHRESAFNRAVVLTELNLREQAKEAWNKYLQLDPDSPWAQEARRRLADLERPQRGANWNADKQRIAAMASATDDQGLVREVASYAQQMREFVEDDVLTEWGDQYVTGDPRAARSLTEARSIASALAAVTADRLLVDVIAAIDHADQMSKLQMAHGFRNYRDGRHLYEANRVADSMIHFERAEQAFRLAANPMSLWCRHYLGIQQYYGGQFEQSRKTQRALLQEARSREFLALSARAHWMIGLSGTLGGNHQLQISEYSLSLEQFSKLGERENQAAVRNLLSSAYLYLGDYRQVWRHSVAALKELGPLTGDRRYHTVLTSAANKAVRSQLPETALAFADEALAHAVRWGAPEGLIEAHQFRARALTLMGRDREASDAASEARSKVDAVADAAIRARLDAEVSQTEAEVAVSLNHETAIASADRAIDFFNSHRAFMRVPRLLMLKGRALSLAGKPDEAIATLTASVDAFETERSSLPPDDETRISHADEQWNAYRDLVTVRFAHHDVADLLEVVEKSKSRSLSERLLLRSDHAAGGAIADLQRHLPQEAAVVSYFVLSKAVLVWVIRHDGIKAATLTVSADELEAHVSAFLQSAENSDSAPWRTESAWLFSHVVAPLALTNVEELWISADGPLRRVSFGTLFDSNRSRFVVEDAAVASVPSILSVTARITRGFERLVAVAVSDGDRELGLPPLPGALVESREAAAAFPESIVLEGADATAENLRQSIRNASVLHFASHALANLEFPAMSRLQLSSSSGTSQWITSSDLRQLDTRALRLVVLSACGTSTGQMSRSEGASSLGRAFQSTGVPNVMGTLWAVPDAETKRFMTFFYAALSSDETPARSLARAQREAIASGMSHVAWAAWTLQSTEIPLAAQQKRTTS